MLIETLTAASCGLIAYHHAVYPLALKGLARIAEPARSQTATRWPSLALIIPAYNEAAFIEAKIRNCASLIYAEGRLRIVIVCDGCTDDTAEIARAAIDSCGEAASRFELVVHDANRGKIAVLNGAIANCEAEVVALSDASALLGEDALTRVAAALTPPDVGFVTGLYLAPSGTPSQRMYWRYQTAIKHSEAALGSPIGAHGAFYAFRRDLWSPLENDVINDDVILPMRVVARGFRGVYDPAIKIIECEADRPADDLGRRRRLGAGAMQQTLRLIALADPRRPGLAFAFLSGKALRAFVPFLLATAYAGSLWLSGSSKIFAVLAMLQTLLYLLAAIGMVAPKLAAKLRFAGMSQLVAGYVATGLGALDYLLGRRRGPWARVNVTPDASEDLALTPGAAAGKRALDVVVASLALVAFAILFVPIALAIKLESKGPIFYRQLRVGLRTRRESRLFYLTKFRTMRADAESKTGAVWATERDPRITRVGNFLRKTRLDEIPQCLDVLRGDMSIVGPRPERPQFFNRLEDAIPFYAERTYGLKPGITGLAQVTLPYDSTIEDVRAKVLHDHAYALRLMAPGGWWKTDLAIIFRTFSVMALGKGR